MCVANCKLIHVLRIVLVYMHSPHICFSYHFAKDCCKAISTIQFMCIALIFVFFIILL